MNEMRVLFFGMLGRFSQPPLCALIEANVSVAGVIIPTDNLAAQMRELNPVTVRPELAETAVFPISLAPSQPNIVHLAWQHHIPVYEVSRLSAPETRQTIVELRPNVACVACFNKRIPASLLELPQHGFLNVHPSLLPQFRGPAPLFWTFRAGIQESGVTIHFMDAGLDTGNIAQQAPLTLPAGISGSEADVLTGTHGGQLLVKTLHQLADNTLIPRPQPEGGSHQPWPQTSDFHIPVSWSAQRAFNFMRGTAEFGQPYVIELEKGGVWVKTAVSFTNNVTLNKPYEIRDDTIQIQFTDGVVTAVLISLE